MLLRNKSLIISMVTFGPVSVPSGLNDGSVTETIRFKKVYVDLISKKKDNNLLQHFVATVNTRIPNGCYAQAYVRQGKFLWNYCMKLDDEFDEARKDIESLGNYIQIPSNPSLSFDEITLEVNADYLNSINPDEQSQSNENEEVGDCGVAPNAKGQYGKELLYFR
jgi:hypothetical protein